MALPSTESTPLAAARHPPPCRWCFTAGRYRWRAALVVAAAVVATVTGPRPVQADEVTFDPAFLEDASLDMRRFSRPDYVLPGDYLVDLTLNQTPLGRYPLRVEDIPDGTQRLTLPLDAWLAARLEPALEQEVRHSCRLDANCFLGVDAALPGASLDLAIGDLRAHLSVPQALLHRLPRGQVDSARWEPGTTALLANYQVNGYRSSTDEGHYQSAFLGTTLGANLGLWQFRSSLNVSRSDDGDVDWDSLHHYVQRPLPDQGLLLRAGEINTRGDFFDSLALRGVTLRTETRMLPDSRRGYAPVARGSARTQAHVTISQQGRRLLETSVPPGPFEIDDLYPTGYGGDLEVKVTEADGRVERYSVPYAAVPGLLRPGQSRLSLAAGQYHAKGLDDPPSLLEAGYRRGLGNAITAYGGAQLSEHYWSPLIGAAFNTPAGAIAVDAQYAHADLPQGERNGWSLEASYSRHLQSTDTDINLAAYRYSTTGFVSLADAAWIADADDDGTQADEGYVDNSTTIDQRSRLQLNLSQPLGPRTRISATGSLADYWHRGGTESSYQLSLSHRIGRVSLALNLSRTDNREGEAEHRALVSLTLPLSNASFAPRLGVSASRDSRHHDDAHLDLTGTLGDERELSYGLFANQTRGPKERYRSYGLNLSSGTSVGRFTAAGSKSDDYRQLSIGASGAVLVHRHGVTFGQSTGDTVGLVSAPGGAGARVTNAANLTLDDDGEALVPYLTAYHDNEVQLDPRGAATSVEFQRTSIDVAPYAGAVVPLRFATRTGLPVVIVLEQNGRGVPLGAEVSATDGRKLGVVGAGGMLLLRDLTPGTSLQVTLGGERRCWARPVWTPPTDSDEIPIVTSPCQPTPPKDLLETT